MKIGNFEVSKKTIGIVLGLVGLFVFLIVASTATENKKRQEALDKATEAQNNYVEPTTETAYQSWKEELIALYGEPPEGYMWTSDGELYVIGSDELNCEEVIYSYVRALSILDFSTAGQYSAYGTIINRYRGYYEDDAEYSAYLDFLRKQMKLSMASLEVNSIKSEAVFADGTKIVNCEISCIDLSDKEFYKQDEEEIFNNLRVYFEEDSDSVRAQQYLLEYMYAKYEDGTVPKRKQEIELVLEKQTDGGWVITNENELMHVICYEDGTDVYSYILEDYQEWVEIKRDEEERARQQAEYEAEQATATESEAEEVTEEAE